MRWTERFPLWPGERGDAMGCGDDKTPRRWLERQRTLASLVLAGRSLTNRGAQGAQGAHVFTRPEGDPLARPRPTCAPLFVLDVGEMGRSVSGRFPIHVAARRRNQGTPWEARRHTCRVHRCPLI